MTTVRTNTWKLQQETLNLPTDVLGQEREKLSYPFFTQLEKSG